ncbi:MAG: prepilin-type N-terminal cleavage/methylation domain-containing protein [Vulcanimicrobiota bacterium]
MNGRMRHRGFSLLELLLVMVVIALAMIAVASGGGHAPKEKADSKALAETLAEELRIARQKAMSKEIPVGVIFPSDEKFPGEECKSPVMQSCYILEGETPKHTRTIDYSKVYPSTYIFIGFWDLAPGHGSVTSDQPSTGSNYDTFDVENWGAGTEFKDCRDFALIFTPAGTVRTNKLPNFDCDFHILVNRAVAYEVAALPTSAFDDGFMLCFLDPGKYFKLTSVCEPYTINISVHGEITVTPGVTGLPTGSPVVTTDPFHVDPVPAPPAPPVTLNNPTIDTVDINPAPNAATLPSGADATVRKEQYVTFTVKASDANSDTLWCRWTAVKTMGAAGGTGGITPEEESRMEWNYSENKWNAVTEWRPPSDAAIGDRYTLTCTVSDRNGGTVTVAKVVEIVGGKMSFWKFDGTTREIWVMNEDGVGRKKLYSFNGYTEGPTVFSPDGTKIIFCRCGAVGDICMMNSDGSGLLNITQTPKAYRSADLSPDGTKIAYEVQNDPNIEIWVQGVDTAAIPILLCYGHTPRWSPDGLKIAFENTGIKIKNADGSGSEELLIDDPGRGQASWSPDGSKILYTFDQDGSSLTKPQGLKIIEVATKVKTVLTDCNTYADKGPSWSYDGTKIAFFSDREGNYGLFIMDMSTKNIRRLDNEDYFTDNDNRISWIR